MFDHFLLLISSVLCLWLLFCRHFKIQIYSLDFSHYTFFSLDTLSISVASIVIYMQMMLVLTVSAQLSPQILRSVDSIFHLTTPTGCLKGKHNLSELNP